MRIKIGDIWTLTVENWNVMPDDRQEKIDVIGGVVVQDFGRIPEGDVISCNITIRASDAAVLAEYWYNRELVDVRDEADNVWQHRRILVKRYSYRPYFSNVFDAEIEMWGI